MGGYVAKQAFLPPRPTEIFRTKERVTITTKRNHKIPALFIKYPNAKARFTLLFSHGNAEDLGAIEDWMVFLSHELKTFKLIPQQQTNVFAYDYSGYGFSTFEEKPIPQCSETYCYENIDASYDYLTQQGITPDEIVVMGRSLGSGPTTDIASRRPVKGVILQSPLLSAVRVVVNTKFTLPIDIFANADKIKKIKSPIFIIHGTVDEVININHGKELYKMIKGTPTEYPPWWIEGAGHNDIEADWEKPYVQKISEFLDHLAKLPDPPEAPFSLGKKFLKKVSSKSSDKEDKSKMESVDSRSSGKEEEKSTTETVESKSNGKEEEKTATEQVDYGEEEKTTTETVDNGKEEKTPVANL